MKNFTDAIVAIITPPGRGGVGIVRISGPSMEPFIGPLVGCKLTARMATLKSFLDDEGRTIDRGIALYFPAPGSFTGEETLELQAHGGPVILDQLVRRAVSLGARPAAPGEYSERAFLNGKLDLAQAEAISDLINAGTEQAAAGATRSLKGEFSRQVNELLVALNQLRVYVEAAIDFPEEDLDFLSDGKVESDLSDLIRQIKILRDSAAQGVLLHEGLRVAIAGPPNVGKSSLLNRLAGQERAIVTDTPGTTRDVLSQQINLDGLPIHIIDTAGLRETEDAAEKEGIRRAWMEIAEADRVLWLVDARTFAMDQTEVLWPEYKSRHPERDNITVVCNKVDLLTDSPKMSGREKNVINISALTGVGVDGLKQHLKNIAGYQGETSGLHTARRRHLTAIDQTNDSLHRAEEHLTKVALSGELVAEELRQAHRFLGQIIGIGTNEDLLAEIFSSFCIGK